MIAFPEDFPIGTESTSLDTTHAKNPVLGEREFLNLFYSKGRKLNPISGNIIDIQPVKNYYLVDGKVRLELGAIPGHIASSGVLELEWSDSDNSWIGFFYRRWCEGGAEGYDRDSEGPFLLDDVRYGEYIVQAFKVPRYMLLEEQALHTSRNRLEEMAKVCGNY
jgi:hypothetical protein